MKILFLTPEAVPFAKTGGLADVSGSLPPALKRIGLDVRLVLPLYREIKNSRLKTEPVIGKLDIPLGNNHLNANILETKGEEDLPIYLIEREDLYDRPGLYGYNADEYYDNFERFFFYCNAALMLSEAISFQPDIIHCHDWQTGLIPALLHGPYSGNPCFGKTRTIFTIHNIGYQGLFPADKLSVTGLPLERFYNINALEYWGKISLLKSGIVFSDAVTTVSPTYAQEIQTPEYGMGMEGIVAGRKDNLHGILNGIDYNLWSPEKDKLIPFNFSENNIEGKKKCKEKLIQEFHLNPILSNRPILGIVSRIDSQKGFDLLISILERILSFNAGIAILGSGDEKIQEEVKKAAEKYSGLVGYRFEFDESLAHRIIAGADIFLIPSRYEPCGLTQMYALKYGTVPVVRGTGGLEDTIIHYDKDKKTGNGFKFKGYSSEQFLKAIREAIKTFENKARWRQVIINGMKADFSWGRSAEKYKTLFKTLLS